MRILIALLLLMPLSAFSQKSDFGNWLIYFGNKQINPKFNWHHEVQYRSFNLIDDIEQLLLRTGLGYNLTENNNNILLGYAFIYSEPYLTNSDLKTNFNEHRIYQQFITRQSFGRMSLQHRYRFEQRFFGLLSNGSRVSILHFGVNFFSRTGLEDRLISTSPNKGNIKTKRL